MVTRLNLPMTSSALVEGGRGAGEGGGGWARAAGAERNVLGTTEPAVELAKSDLTYLNI